MTQAETILNALLKSLDRQSMILNNKDLAAVKLVIRLKRGVVQVPEISFDIREE